MVIHMKKISTFLQKFAIELAIFFLLTMQLIFSVVPTINGWVGAWYCVDYSLGFSSRMFIGSLLHVFCGSYIPERVAYHFIICSFLVLFALLAYLVGFCMKKCTDNTTKIALAVLTGLYLACAGSPGYLWTNENMGRLDLYLFIFSMVMMVIFFHMKNKYVAFVLYGVLVVACMLTHQVYVFLFSPVLLIILLYELYEDKFSKKTLIPAGIIMLIICGFFIYLQFLSQAQVKFDDVNKMTEVVKTMGGAPTVAGTLEEEYFWEFSNHVLVNYLPDLRERTRTGIFTMFLLIPLYAVIGYVWHQIIMDATDKKERFKYRLMLFMNMSYVPTFLLLVDWGRWFGAYFSVQLLLFLVLIGKKDIHAMNGLRKFGAFVMKHPVPFVCLIVYLASMEKFEGINYMNEAQTFYLFTYQIRMMIKGLFV